MYARKSTTLENCQNKYNFRDDLLLSRKQKSEFNIILTSSLSQEREHVRNISTVKLKMQRHENLNGLPTS